MQKRNNWELRQSFCDFFFFTQYDFSHHYQIGNDKLQLLCRFCNLDEIIGSLGNHFAIVLFKRNMIFRTNTKLGMTNYNY